jgi:hypothetical protein
MRWSNTMMAIALTVLLIPWEAKAGKAQGFRFARDDVGKVPAGWKATQTNQGAGSVWKVVADETAPSTTGLVLAQTAESPSAVFNLCVATNTSFKDVEASVAFKAVRGNKDQGGGIVWRYQNAANYYVARMNPLEDNFRVYKVIDGKRIQLSTAEDVKVPVGEWHKLKIKMAGDHIQCDLDGKKLLDVRDNSIAQAGQVGLWTKADAQTYFDSFIVSRPKG